MPLPTLTPEEQAASDKKKKDYKRQWHALNVEKKKAAAVSQQTKALNNLAGNEKVPILPAGFSNTLNLAFRHCGGMEAMMDLCAYCADECEEAGRIYLMYRETVLDDRDKLIPEELCRKADISPARLLGVLAKAAFQRNVDLSKMMMALESPTLIAAAAKFGAAEGGHQDRKMLLQAAGIVPMGGSKGVAVTVNNANVQGAEEVEYGGLPNFASDAILITSE